MKKKICDIKPGTPFKHDGQVFIRDEVTDVISLTNGKVVIPDWDDDVFEDGNETLVTVCKRIRKSDIKERK